jgi:hypothetical protein
LQKSDALDLAKKIGFTGQTAEKAEFFNVGG